MAALKLLDGELMIIVTQQSVEMAIADYGKRWAIETLFGIYTTQHFWSAHNRLHQQTHSFESSANPQLHCAAPQLAVYWSNWFSLFRFPHCN